MTKRAESKYKLDRRMGQNIWGRPKSPVNRREYGPGQHGQRRKSKLSDFGVHPVAASDARKCQECHAPPSTLMVCPVRYDAPGPHRNVPARLRLKAPGCGANTKAACRTG